jgi:chromosome segregation ATPase
VLGEAAAEQLMAQQAQAATAQQELARLRQNYKESQTMLQTLYHEAQILNTELWEQNDQLTAEVEDLRTQLAEALHHNTLSTIQESSSDSEHEAVSRDTREPSSQSRTVATSVAGLLPDARSRGQSQASLNAQDSSASLGQESSRGGEAAQLRAGLAASQREVQRLQALLFDRNKLVTELEAQLLGVAEDIRTFEATVVRVEVLTSSLSLSKAVPALYRKHVVG